MPCLHRKQHETQKKRLGTPGKRFGTLGDAREMMGY
jgi:hypothetical protein